MNLLIVFIARRLLFVCPCICESTRPFYYFSCSLQIIENVRQNSRLPPLAQSHEHFCFFFVFRINLDDLENLKITNHTDNPLPAGRWPIPCEKLTYWMEHGTDVFFFFSTVKLKPAPQSTNSAHTSGASAVWLLLLGNRVRYWLTQFILWHTSAKFH